MPCLAKTRHSKHLRECRQVLSRPALPQIDKPTATRSATDRDVTDTCDQHAIRGTEGRFPYARKAEGICAKMTRQFQRVTSLNPFLALFEAEKYRI